jgi:uncharacterized protein (UPF0218 family)
LLEGGECLHLPVELRSLAALRYPGSQLLPTPKAVAGGVLVAVGDRVSREAGEAAAMAVFDCREMRRARSCPQGFNMIIDAVNPPGTVSRHAVRALAKAVQLVKRGERVAVRVRGEEDLLVLPLMVLADYGWVVVYGQPGIGVCSVKVTRYAKLLALGLLSRMKPGPCPEV